MKLFIYFNFIFWISLLGFCHAKVEDYLKGIDFKRSFNPIEGKVVEFNITMSEKDYNDMVESSQLSFGTFYGKLRGLIPEEMKYSTKVNLSIKVDDEVYSYQKVKLKVGGNSSRTYGKLGYNLKLNNQTFFGRNNLRLRSEYTDISHIRSKLAIDLVNKWNIPTVQESYANLYINNKYFGFYQFLDAIKPNWIHDIYNIPEEEDVKTLYSCRRQVLAFNPDIVRSICQNEKDKYLNYTQPLYDMVDEIYNYTSLNQLEKTFDNVENIRKILIFEYLFSAPDNFIMAGNNMNFFQKSNGKWEFIPMDFNVVFLINFDLMIKQIPYQIPRKEYTIDYAKVRFEDWHSPNTRKPFIDILYYSDKEKFIKVLKEMLITGFNPDEIFPRIDELAKFVEPYIKRDITPDENGNLPGRINSSGISVNYTIEGFWDSLKNDDYKNTFGLKKYFQVKFDSVCELYGINKKEILIKAKIYRKKRAIQISIDNIKQDIIELKKKLNSSSTNNKNKYQKKINKLLKKVKKYEKKLSHIKIEY